MDYVVVFVAGLVIAAVVEYFVLRNNPKHVRELEKQVEDLKAEAWKYREAYEAIVTKIKLKVTKNDGLSL